MKLPSDNSKTDKKVASNRTDVDTILVAQDTVHQGAMFGLVSNGGKKSIGNYIIEFVNNGTKFPIVQIYQCALGVTPKVQTWNKTKTVTKKVEVPAKQKKVSETMKVSTKVQEEDLF